MANASSYKRATNDKFNPLDYFPARVRGKKITAVEAKPDGSGVAGSTDLKAGIVAVPVGSTAYERAVRRHEALHAIYSPQSDNPEDYNLLGQAVEDARLYLNENNLSLTPDSSVRRDDMTAAMTDLRRGSGGDKGLAALLALRSTAILQSRSLEDETKHWPRAAKLLSRMCESIAPGFDTVLYESLADIKAGNVAAAKEKLAPYVVESEKTKMMAKGGATFFPNGKPGKPGKPEGPSIPTIAFKGEKAKGAINSESADMLSPEDLATLAASEFIPTMNVIELHAVDNIPTYFGESHKRTQAGSKIDPKRLATIVGPSTPSIFLRSIHRQGGTVVIDASGSMSISTGQLQEICALAPMATVAFYNGLTDANTDKDMPLIGNLWVYAIKGKRAADLSLVNHDHDTEIEREYYKTKAGSYRSRYVLKPGRLGTVYGGGNLVDFQAIQWALTQPAPRYFLTDVGFTGPCTGQATRLFQTAIARKKINHILRLDELRSILQKRGNL